MTVIDVIIISVFCVLAGLYIISLIGSVLYFKLGWCKWFYHDILHWHEPDKSKPITFDVVNIHSTCKYCGQHIIQDSQGNWFVV